jgi:hypothetical protein
MKVINKTKQVPKMTKYVANIDDDVDLERAIRILTQEQERRRIFQPITLEISFESEQELNHMWHRLNPHISTMLITKDGPVVDVKYNDDRVFWDELNSLCKKNRT